MPIPKSKSLKKQEAAQNKEVADIRSDVKESNASSRSNVQIKPIECFNDFVAVMRFAIDTSVALVGDNAYTNEGIVVGVGPGVTDNAGGRLVPSVKIGDVVTFTKNIVTELAPEGDNSFYKGKKIVILTERSVICKLPSIDYETVGDDCA